MYVLAMGNSLLSINLSEGDPDIVVCNAGVLVVKSFLHLSEQEIRRTMDINVLGCFWVRNILVFDTCHSNIVADL